MTTCQNNMRRPCRPGYNGYENGYPAMRPGCSCPDQSRPELPSSPVLAMAYVPWQRWEQIYEPCKGLKQGTIFESLDKPFLGKGGHRL